MLACSHQQVKEEQSPVQIESGFKTPPLSAQPGAFWCWLNGNMNKESITRDLEAMKSKGMGSVGIWDVGAISNPDSIPAGGPFLGDESVSLIKYAISEGKRLNIKIGIIASSGWNAGGSWVTPDWASKSLFFRETQVKGPQKISVSLPFPEFPENCPMKDAKTPVFFKDIAVLAFPENKSRTIENISQVIDLTSRFHNGMLEWEVPSGKWTIIRFVCSNNGQRLIVPSPYSDGLFIDFLDPEATKRHLKYFMDKLGITPENASQNGLTYFEFDSMELGNGIPWTDSFGTIFNDRQGYDIVSYLPVLAGWSIKGETEKFRYDFNETVSDQLIYSHYKTGTEFLKKYNTDLVAEAGGPGPPISITCTVDALKALGNVSIPRGEFWIRHRNMFLIKEIASASHIYGKKLVDAESFTTWRRWKDSPFELKKYADRAFCEGLNNITFHTFAGTAPEAGLPGRTYHAGYDINPGTTWWNKSRPFMDYLSRCSYMLQQGLFVADLCYYYGDQTPNFYPLFHDVPEKPMLNGLGKGYDYDVVNSDVIITRMSVKDGRIMLPDGMSYSALLLPDQTDMPLEVLKKIADLVEAGATVVGPRPATVPGLNAWEKKNDTLNIIAGKLWGNTDGKNVVGNKYGKGEIIFGLTAGEELQKKGIEKDFSYSGISEIDFIHRTTSIGEVYFLRNEKEESVKSLCKFRISDKYPELWDATTGDIFRVEKYTRGKGNISFEIELPAHGSVFVVFNKADRKNITPATQSEPILTTLEIPGPWEVSFPEKWGAPPNATFDKLISWTDSEDKGIKYFSGTASYRNKFTVNNEVAGGKIFIDLGEMRDVAEIYINGTSAGIVWEKPFEADISSLVRAGINDLKVEVVNMWVNRLTGDMMSDPKDRYCRTNHYYMKSEIWPGGDETYRIQTSGLLGPVKLIYQR